MTSQGKHRTLPHTELVPFNQPTKAQTFTLQLAIGELERKGYEVRAMRLHYEDHGKKVAVVLHISPAPGIGPSKRPELVGEGGWRGRGAKYHGQNVGTTRRRNIETLLAYVEGLPNVRQSDGDVDGTGGGAGVHEHA